MKPKIAIIHFGDIGKYPPAINLIRFFSYSLHFKEILVCSQSKFSDNNKNVKWIGSMNKETGIKPVRAISYLWFYVKTFINLIAFKGNDILYYERFSFPPVYWYVKVLKIFRKKINIYCHYHEYSTLEEIENGMIIGRYAHKLEIKSYKNFSWISHTNHFRSQMFLNEHPFITSLIQILPNYPPEAWSHFCKSKMDKKENLVRQSLKLVYVGSLDIESMYTKEMAEWVIKQKGRVVWDIYSGQYNLQTYEYITQLKSSYIQFKGSINYDQLPIVLKEYDVGIILYKGVLNNHIFSEPNKYFEYYVCGLDVWYPKEILGMKSNRQTLFKPLVIELDFTNLITDLEKIYLGNENLDFNYKAYCAEDEYCKLFKVIQNIKSYSVLNY